MLKKLLLSVLFLATITAYAQTKKPVPAKKPAVQVKPSAKPATSAITLKTAADSLSYAMGVSVGEYLRSQGIENLNFTLLNKAIDQSLKKSPTLFDVQTANMVMHRSAGSGMKKKATAEREKGQQFLAQNKKKAGVTETASGLQYEILTPGTGLKPTAKDTILVHYAGRLLDGKEFDSSYKRGEPITFPVSGFISGWTEALQLMPVGSKWRLYIPSKLGYGDSGAGADIPGGATLVFDIELLEIPNRKAK